MKEYFPGIGRIVYEGRASRNPLAFRHYDPDKIVGEKPMKEHLRFAMAYWHTINGTGADPFGMSTMVRTWQTCVNGMDVSREKMHAAFEFMEKSGLDYFTFHDRDIAPEGRDLAETNANLDEMAALCQELMQKSGKKLLWGTSNLFSNPRYVHGAATSPNAEVFAHAAAQVKKAIEITKKLGGENFVFWGGREGYETLLNTDMKLELDNMARFLTMAVEYAGEAGFKGQFLIEPKPKEPAKHQYDFNVGTILGFLKRYGLHGQFKVNIEANHATLAGHTFQHELHLARINTMLGSLDVNQGDLLLGWDTDQFPTNIYDATQVMYEVLKNGGIAPGGLNFDAKTRRGSFAPLDLFISHIAGMDTLAWGLKIAHDMLKDGILEDFMNKRYESYQAGIGRDIMEGKVGFKELEKYALGSQAITNESGRQEMLESIVNDYISRSE